jgi:Arc/MetJ-type ribon-helix-helix transcriptional regulator
MAETILQMLGSALVGGGLWRVLFLRKQYDKQRNTYDKDEYTTVSEVVKQGMNDLRELSNRISELERDKVEILEENNRLKRQNEILTNQLDKR